jgi:hypothetical protein
MSAVTVQSYESFTGPFYPGVAPADVALAIAPAPEDAGRIRLFGLDAQSGSVGFALDAAMTAKAEIEQRLRSELAGRGSTVSVVIDWSTVPVSLTGGSGGDPGPGPGCVRPLDAVAFASNVVMALQLDGPGQQALGDWLQTHVVA